MRLFDALAECLPPIVTEVFSLLLTKFAKIIYTNRIMENKGLRVGLKSVTAVTLIVALLLTFTVSDYYIFNRIDEFNLVFVLSQWIKKAGLLLLPLAVYFNKKKCADLAKYILPVFIVLSCFTFGDFFEATKLTGATGAELVYASINEFIPKWLNMTLFYVENAAMLAACVLLFIKDGFKTDRKSWVYLSFPIVAVMPLNIFENFFDAEKVPKDSFLRFNSFSLWHIMSLVGVVAFTIGAYYFLKHNKKSAGDYLVAIAVTLLIQYHSKDSMVMGDGYNVYHTVFACVPLFICNIGVYVAALSVILKKRVLYSISFFIHAAGAVSVFVYCGRPEISNYGLFCSYSALYFTLTHCLLFALCVLPTALGHYKYRAKDCIVSLVYYFVIIVLAAVSSALITSASMSFSVDGYTLQNPDALGADEWLYPNYAFTQINPLPWPIPPVLTVRIWNYDLNVLYIFGLYASYVGMFYALNGLYYAFLGIRKAVLKRFSHAAQPVLQPEIAATTDSTFETREI